MTSPEPCPACGAELPADGPGALCPHCGHERACGTASTTGFGAPPPAALDLAQLAPHLPQLEILGLAKLLGPVPAEPQLTASHQIVGTLKYMAPEQLERPLEVDHRADLYSLGVVLYEMLTGELPLGRFAPPSEKGVGDSRLDEVI